MSDGAAGLTLDLSNYDWETFVPDCFAANGCEGVILGCQDPNIAWRMADGLRRARIPIIGVYGFDYFGTPGDLGDIWDAIAIALAYDIRRVWVDCEIDSYAGSDPFERAAEIEECVQAIEAAGLSAGIYTGSWWWVPQVNNTEQFAHLPLWHSGYYDDGRAIRTVNYGGWTDVAVHQWTDRLPFCGRDTRDANFVFEELDMAMTIEERAWVEGLAQQITDQKKQLDEQARWIDQLQTQQWGEETPPRDDANPYAQFADGANATAFELARRIDALSGPSFVGDHTHEQGKVVR